MPKLIVASRELRYGGRSLKTGDEFDASNKDAKILKAIGKAKDAPLKTRAVAKRASRSDVNDAQQVALGVGLYQRRDLRAED